jgi:general secretion pathway protein K
MGAALVSLTKKVMLDKDDHKNERGVALILTIMAVTFIIALSLEFNRNMRTQVTSAGNIAHGLKALYAAKSAISHGSAVLKADPPEFDSLQDSWADTQNAASMDDVLEEPSGDSPFELKINDLSGRIPINMVVDNDKVKRVFERLLNLDAFGLDSTTVSTILDSTMDWIDRAGDDDFHRLHGAEDDYYQSLEKPYHCKNGPMDAPEELLLVKGITPELFYGNDEKPGIGRCITVFADKEKPQINVNTAESVVLAALSNDYDGETLAGFREDATEAELENWEWFKDKIDNNLLDLASARSTYFEIVGSGRFGDAKKKVVSVVRRNPDNGDIQMLSRRVE